MLDCLGYSFRLDRYMYGRKLRYWNMHPSKKALAREREKLRVMISKSYFRAGYNLAAFRPINAPVGKRLARHLRRRSQPRMAPRNGTSVYAHLQQLGLIYL